MQPGIESFAGVIIVNPAGQVLLARKLDQYAFAIPWCRIVPGKPLRQCLRERVIGLTGLEVEPVFLGPSEHIEAGEHLISFDHRAAINIHQHHFVRDDIEFLWALPDDLHSLPLVPLTRQILEKHFIDRGVEPELSSMPKPYRS